MAAVTCRGNSAAGLGAGEVLVHAAGVPLQRRAACQALLALLRVRQIGHSGKQSGEGLLARDRRARAWRGTGAGGGHASRALNTLCSHGSAAGRTLLTRVSVPRVAGSRGERRMPSALPALRSTRCRFAELGRLRAARSAAFFPPALAARPGCGASQPAFSARPRAASVLLLRAMRAALACS